MKTRFILPLILTVGLTACGGNDKQAQLEQQLKEQQEQIAQLQAAADQTVYQLQPQAVNETLSAEAQEKGKNGEVVTGNDGQQYMYDSSTGSWLLQSLIGAAAGSFIGNALANKFTRAPATSPAVQRVQSHYAQQYKGNRAAPQPPRATRPATGNQNASSNNTYRRTQQAPSNHSRPMRRRR